MSKALSTNLLRAGNCQQTDELLVLLLTIQHASLAEPIRLVRDRQPLTSRGQLYQAAAFDVPLPNDDERRVRAMTLVVDNVDRRLVEFVRTVVGRVDFTLEVVLRSSPDLVEVAYTLQFRAYEIEAQRLSITLAFDDLLNARAVRDVMGPATTPGVFDAF